MEFSAIAEKNSK